MTTNAMILLLVSDSVARAVIGETLEHGGYTVEAAGDLGTALKRIGEAAPDLLVIGPYIEDMSGYETAKFLRTKVHGLPVLMVAGIIDDERLKYRLELEGFEAFPKPYSAAETAKQALVRGQRPWVGPENEPNVALNKSNEGIQSVIVIPIRNYGLSPAFHISYYLEPLDIGNSLNDIQEASKRFCQIAEIGAITTDKVPGTSFGFYMLPNAVQRILDKRAWNAQKPFNAVVGCVAYVDQFHDTPIQSPIHHTSLCFRSFAPIAPGQPIPQLFGCSFAESMD